MVWFSDLGGQDIHLLPKESARLDVGHLAPIALGGTRLILHHPQDPGALIKVARPDRLGRRSRRRQLFLGQSAIVAFKRRMICEAAEYLSIRDRNPAGAELLAAVLRFVETDLGPGLVVARMQGRDGGLAPNLEHLLRRDGLTQRVQDFLAEFCQAIATSGVIVNDLRPANIVLAFDASHGERLVLVDGFGEKTLFAINRASRLARNINCRRHLRRLMARMQSEAVRRTTLVPDSG